MNTENPSSDPPLTDAQLQESLSLTREPLEKAKTNPNTPSPSKLIKHPILFNSSQPYVPPTTNPGIQQPIIEKKTEKVQPKIPGININIIRNYAKKGAFSDYMVYVIEGHDDKGSFEIARRYSDFVKLRDVMDTRWPGRYIPNPPQKTLLNCMKEGFINKRKEDLNCFLKEIASFPFLYYSEEFQLFLRYNDLDFQQKLQNLEQNQKRKS